jgi:hypothetical protein
LPGHSARLVLVAIARMRDRHQIAIPIMRAAFGFRFAIHAAHPEQLTRECAHRRSQRAPSPIARVHIGVRFERWVELVDSDRVGVQSSAVSCIERLTGEKPPHVRAQAESWWNERRSRFDSAICYRAGKPAAPEILVRGARGRHSKESRADLRQMAGLAFITPSLDPPAIPETQAIDAWWAAHAVDFVPGKLHRWGRSYDPTACD